MDIVIHKREKAGHTYQKGDELLVGVPKEATVLGVSPSWWKENKEEIYRDYRGLVGLVASLPCFWLTPQANQNVKYSCSGNYTLLGAFI